MAKRRNKKGKQPNLPQEALERARQGTDETEAEDESSSQEASQASESTDTAARREAREERRRRRRESSRGTASSTVTRTANARGARAKAEPDELDSAGIKEALANPTTQVSEEDLRKEYGYVVADIRNMLVLAVILMVALVLLAQLI